MSTFNELIDFTRSTTGTYLDSVVYGDELVTNGTFATDSDWTVPSVWDISAGVATATNADGSYSTSALRQPLSLELGKLYKVSVDASSITGQVKLYQGLFSSGLQVTGAGVVTGFLTGEGAVNLNLLATAGASAVVDNVSVKEVIGGQVSGTPLLRTAAINEPRLEYDASGNPLGLLIEEARSNLFRYSQALSNVSHSLITTDNATVSPDGTQNASLCIPTSANVEHYIDDQTVIAGTDYAISCFAKYGSGSYLLSFRGSAIGGDAPQFNLQTGTVVNEGASSVWSNTKIEDVGNGWYKCSSVGNPNSASPLRFQIIRSDAAVSFIGDGTGHYIWGAQVETGAFPTSYIPTSGSTVTRAADIASLPVERFAYNQDQGSIVCHFNYFFESGNSKRAYEFSDGTDNNVIRMLDHNNVNQLQASVKSGNAVVAGILINAPTMLSGVKTFQSYKLNGYSGGADGTLAGIDSNGASPIGIHKLNIGSRRDGTANMSGYITSLQYYPKKLTNEELELLTQPSASPTMNLTFDGQATSTLVEGLHD